MSAITPQTSMPADSSSPSGMLTTSARFVRIQASCSAGSADLYLIQKNEGGKWFKTGAVLRLDADVADKAVGQLIVENLTPTTAYHLLQERGGTVTAYIAGQDSTTSVTTLAATTLSVSGAATLSDTLAVTGATTLTGQLNANGGMALAGTAPSAAADKVMQGVADIAGATTAALKTNYEGGATKVERVRGTGSLNILYIGEDMTDDNSVALPVPSSGKIGILEISIGPSEWGRFSVQNDGTCTKLDGSTNAVTTDTDAKLVLFSSTGTPTLRNRLGSTLNAVGSYRWS